MNDSRPISRFLPLIGLSLLTGVICGAASCFILDPHFVRARSAVSGNMFWLRFNHDPRESEIFDSLLDNDPVFSPSDRRKLHASLTSGQATEKARDEIVASMNVDVSPFEADDGHASVNPDGTLANKPMEVRARSGREYVCDSANKPMEADLVELERFDAMLGGNPSNLWRLTPSTRLLAQARPNGAAEGTLEALADDLSIKGWLEKKYYSAPPVWFTEPSTRYMCPRYLSWTVCFVGVFGATTAVALAAFSILPLLWKFFLARMGEFASATREK